MEVAELVYFPRTRKEAKEKGYKRFFTGKMCKYGHIAERDMEGRCILCARRKIKEYKERNPEWAKAWSKAGEEKWRKNNPDLHNERNRDYYRRNKEKVLIRTGEYRRKNKGKANAWGRKHYASKINAIPAWVADEDIESVYAYCPDGMEVDHVVPLQSKYVCGLHCPDNLQYLKPEDNKSKGNRVWPEMPFPLDRSMAYKPETEDDQRCLN